jgi:5-methyltetrahydrofolate--homocysteine methyltransferase
MIIIGEKINGAIPSVKRAIEERDAEFIRQRALMQAETCADFIDVCAGGEADREYDALNWLIGIVQSATEVPLCLDSPNEKMLEKIFPLAQKPGMLNSVNEEGTKCETIFPMIAKTDWQVIGLTCDQDGIPSDTAKKIDIAKSIIDKAVKYGVDVANLHIDPCVMALATMPTAMRDFMTCITKIKEYAPEVKITGAISNISFDMPMRKVVNQKCMTLAIYAGLDSAIMNPCDMDMIATIYAAEALCGIDKSGRKYNRAYRQGKFGGCK